jgi:WD40 repeat protein
MSLDALTRAAMCLPDFSNEPTTGISPVTPYLELLKALDDAAQKIRGIGPYDAVVSEVLLQRAEQLYSKLQHHHASFLCAQCRYYKLSDSTHKVYRVYFSYNSARLFVGTNANLAWDLDTVTGESSAISASSLPNSSTFYSAHFTRDGQRVYWGSSERPLFIVNRDTGKRIPLEAVLSPGWSGVEAVSHDGTRVLVTGESDPLCVLCDAVTGKKLVTLEGHSKAVFGAAFTSVTPPKRNISHDIQDVYTTTRPVLDELDKLPMETERPRQIATASFDQTVKVWDIDSGSCITTFDGLGATPGRVCWSSDATMLAFGVGSNVHVYEAGTRDLKYVLEGHTKTVFHVAFSPNDQLLASASCDHTVRVWNITTKTSIAVLTGPTDLVHYVEFSPDGQFIVAAAQDGVWIWDVNPDSVHRTTDTQRGRVHSAVRKVVMLQKPGFGKKTNDMIEDLADQNC